MVVTWYGEWQEMVQLVVGLLHAREQGSGHSTKDFLNVFELVCLSCCQTGMPHLASVFDERMDNCGIYVYEMMRFYSSMLE